MDKFIRILAIVATVLVAISLLLLLVSIPLQPLLAEYLFGYPDDMISFLPKFPLVQFFSCLLRLFCVAPLVVCCGNKKGGFWLEILVLVALAVVLPVISSVISTVDSMVTNTYIGGYEAAANSIVNVISNLCMPAGGLGLVLAYVTCGMSIAFKVMNKKLEKMEAVQDVAPEAESDYFVPEADPEDFVPETNI